MARRRFNRRLRKRVINVLALLVVASMLLGLVLPALLR